jgi:hypothetical protein
MDDNQHHMSVSIQLIVIDDVERMLTLFDLEPSDVYHADMSSMDTSGHLHANRALRFIKIRRQEALDTTTLVFFTCSNDATHAEWQLAYRWARYLSAVLKASDGYVPGSVDLVQGTTVPHSPPAAAGAQPVWTSTLTWSASTESFAGMQVNGQQLTHGYSADALNRFAQAFASKGFVVDDIALGTRSGTGREGRVLVVRGALLGPTDGLADAVALDLEHVAHAQTDRMAIIRQKLLHRRARYSACMGDVRVDADLANGVGVVLAFSTMPAVAAVRRYIHVIPETKDKLAELNQYFEPNSYIGFHGDSERPDVIGTVFGPGSKDLVFQGFCRAHPVGERITISLKHGDLYIGCEVAFGHHWGRDRCRSNVIHYRHAASRPGNHAIKSNQQIISDNDRKRQRRSNSVHNTGEE